MLCGWHSTRPVGKKESRGHIEKDISTGNFNGEKLACEKNWNAINHMVVDSVDANAIKGQRERLDPCPPRDIILCLVSREGEPEVGSGFTGLKSVTLEHVYQCLLKIFATGKKD